MDIEEQYKNVAELKKSDVEDLEVWIENQLHLPQTSEKMLILFLNSCLFDVEKTKKCIEYYYQSRSSYSEFFSQRDPFFEKNLKAMNYFIIEPMASLTPQGYGVFYAKAMDPALNTYDFQTHLKLFDMRLHVWLQQVGCVKGFVGIVDMSGCTWRHIKKMGYFNIRRFIGYLLEGLPIRIRGVHIVNPTNIIDKCIQLIFPMISAETRELVHIHRSESLFQCLPPICVPNELGGTAGSIKELHDKYVQTLKDNRDYLIADEKLKSDESKRVRQALLKRFVW